MVRNLLLSFLFAFTLISCDKEAKQPLSRDNFILSFKIGDVVAAIDQSTKTISAELPWATDLTALAPELTISELADVSPKSGDVVDFTDPVTYTVTAEDGTPNDYSVIISCGIFDAQISSVDNITLKQTEEITINGVFASSGNVVKLGETELVIISETQSEIVPKFL